MIEAKVYQVLQYVVAIEYPDERSAKASALDIT